MSDALLSLGRWRQRAAGAWGRPELRWLGAVLLLAAVLRIVWIPYAAREPQELHDPFFYSLYAHQIASGEGYRLLDGSPTAYYPIGYPATLGGVFALVLHTPIPDNLVLAAGSFNVFLGVATVALVYVVGRRLFNPTVGLLGALWLALFPNLVFHTAVPLTETLFNFVVLLGLALLLAGPWRDGRIEPWRLVAFGAVLGFSALVRPISLPFLPLLLVVWLAFRFDWRRSLAYAGIVLAATVAVILPWTVRNAIVMGSPVIISANLGDNLCMGHYEGAPGHFSLPDVCFAGYEHLERPEYELRRNDENTRKALEFAFTHPVQEAKLLVKKARWTWDHDHDGLWAVESYRDDPFIDPDLRRALERTADIFFFFTVSVGGLGLVGLVLAPREPRRVFFLLALLTLAAMPLAFFGDARFHVPAAALLVVPAAWLAASAARVPGLIARSYRAASARRRSGVEVAEAETSMAEQDALQDA